MHMYTTSIVAKMHKIQFIRKKENIFAPERDSGISESKHFLTEMFLWVEEKTVKHHAKLCWRLICSPQWATSVLIQFKRKEEV